MDSVPPEAHARPPQSLRDIYKKFQRVGSKALEEETEIIDSNMLASIDDATIHKLPLLPDEVREIFSKFLRQSAHAHSHHRPLPEWTHVAGFEVKNVPGLVVYPSLFPPEVQLQLLSLLLFRDLSNYTHRTNTHLHYDVPSPQGGKSYFDSSSASLSFVPKNPTVHKPFTTTQYLNKKLRWMTLGGQYDWTHKVYPDDIPPPFPPDIKTLIEDVFPLKAEAAIVNLYSPGDTLSLHRDVSEECAEPLVSVSLGCEAIFVCGLDSDEVSPAEKPSRVAILKLKSGDAVLMSDQARYAWHGVPKVLEGTCPRWMQHWPASEALASEEDPNSFEEWKGWMDGKRINLNIRQMFAADSD